MISARDVARLYRCFGRDAFERRQKTKRRDTCRSALPIEHSQSAKQRIDPDHPTSTQPATAVDRHAAHHS